MVIVVNWIKKRLVGKEGCWVPPIKGRSWMALYIGRSTSPCFPGMDNNPKEYFNLKDTYAVLRILTIKDAIIYYGSLRLLRVRNKGI